MQTAFITKSLVEASILNPISTARFSNVVLNQVAEIVCFCLTRFHLSALDVTMRVKESLQRNTLEAVRSSNAGERSEREDGHTDDSAYGSAKDTAKDSSRDLSLLLRRLLDRTARVHKGRQDLRGKRQQFRQFVQQTTELMTSFLSVVQYSSTQMQVGDERSALQVLQDLQQVNDKICKEMQSYDSYEHSVSIDEYALSLEENQLHQEFLEHRGSNQSHESTLFARSVTLQKPSKPDIPASPISKPIRAYDAEIGKANMLREDLKELALEKDEYLAKKSHGEDLDSEELQFLETYDETYKQSHDELLATEHQIKMLEGPARERGLSPSAIYQPYQSPPSPLELPPSGFGLDQRDTDSVSQMYLDLQGLADAHAGNPVVQNMTQLSFSSSSINRWLSGLPLELVKTTSAFATREGSHLIKFLREQLLEPHEKATSTKSDPKESIAPDYAGSDQLRVDWVKVDNTESPKPKPLTRRRKNISPSSRNLKTGAADNLENEIDASQKFPELDLARTAAVPSTRLHLGRTEDSIRECA